MKYAKTHIVEYAPYQHRNERCAVAVLCNVDGKWTAYPANSLRKARALDPAVNLDALRDGLHAMADELTRSPDTLPLYQSGFGGIQVSLKAGTLNYASEEEFQRGIEWTLSVGIEPNKPKATRERATVSRLFVDVKRAFEAYGWMAQSGQGLAAHKIVARYPLVVDEGLAVDFAFKNGVLHCLQTIDYRNNPAQKKVEASAKLLTLGLSPQVADQKTKRYALIAGTDADEAAAGVKLAERVSTDVFIHESREDMGRLMDTVSVAIGQAPIEALPTN